MRKETFMSSIVFWNCIASDWLEISSIALVEVAIGGILTFVKPERRLVRLDSVKCAKVTETRKSSELSPESYYSMYSISSDFPVSMKTEDQFCWMVNREISVGHVRLNEWCSFRERHDEGWWPDKEWIDARLSDRIVYVSSTDSTSGIECQNNGTHSKLE